jgi:hypothetical protein
LNSLATGKEWSAGFLQALAGLAANAAPKVIAADAETESANAAAKREGAVGALFGEEVQVAIRQEDRTYTNALRESLEGVAVKESAEVRTSAGQVRREVKGERDLGNGLVQEVKASWSVGKDGEAKSLAVREGKVNVSKGHALFEALQEAKVLGAYYTGGGSINGASVRKVRILQEDAFGAYRRISVPFDTTRKTFAEDRIALGDWKPQWNSEGGPKAGWQEELDLLSLASQAGRLAPLPSTEGEDQ